MTYELLLALCGFAFVSSITPGPNNLMLMTSGANFGFGRSVPHMLGVGIGFTVMIAMVGFGIAQIFNTYPVSHTILKVLSVAYMLWLAWKIAHAAPPSEAVASEARPLTFLQAAGFQWVNPKAWAMALTATTVYAGSGSPLAVLTVALAFGAVNIPCISSWTVLGQQMRRVLRNPARLRLFNWTMALLLVASLWPVLVS